MMEQKKKQYSFAIVFPILLILKNVSWLVFSLDYLISPSNFRTEDTEKFYRVGGTYEVVNLSSILDSLAITCIFLIVFFLFAKKCRPWFIVCLLLVDSAWTIFQLCGYSFANRPFLWFVHILRIWLQLPIYGLAYALWLRKNADQVKRRSRKRGILMGSMFLAIHAAAIVYASTKTQALFSASICIIHMTLLFFDTVLLYKAMVDNGRIVPADGGA